MHIYIVSYKNKPIAFMKYEDAINFINKKRKGILKYTDEIYDGKIYTYLPVKIKVN